MGPDDLRPSLAPNEEVENKNFISFLNTAESTSEIFRVTRIWPPMDTSQKTNKREQVEAKETKKRMITPHRAVSNLLIINHDQKETGCRSCRKHLNRSESPGGVTIR